jgi:hypothetical protein
VLDKKAFSKWLQARPRLNIATTNASPTFSQDLPSVTSEPDISLEIAKQTIVGQAAQLIQQAQELEQQEQLLEQQAQELEQRTAELEEETEAHKLDMDYIDELDAQKWQIEQELAEVKQELFDAKELATSQASDEALVMDNEHLNQQLDQAQGRLNSIKIELVQMQSELERTASQRDYFQGQVRVADQERLEAEKERDNAQSEMRKLRQQVNRLKKSGNPVAEPNSKLTKDWFTHPDLKLSDYARFKLDIEICWNTIDSKLRENYPLKDYTIKDGFLEDAKETLPNEYARLVRICTEIICGISRAPRSSNWSGIVEVDRINRDGPNNNCPAVTRQQDDAISHKVYVKQNSPGAPRLYYWLLPDQSVELATIGFHNDFDPGR